MRMVDEEFRERRRSRVIYYDLARLQDKLATLPRFEHEAAIRETLNDLRLWLQDESAVDFKRGLVEWAPRPATPFSLDVLTIAYEMVRGEILRSEVDRGREQLAERWYRATSTFECMTRVELRA